MEFDLSGRGEQRLRRQEAVAGGMRRGFPLRADERERIQMGDNGSCCAPDSLRWRTEQQLCRRDSFDDEHGSPAEWATPVRTLPRRGGLCWHSLFG